MVGKPATFNNQEQQTLESDRFPEVLHYNICIPSFQPQQKHIEYKETGKYVPFKEEKN